MPTTPMTPDEIKAFRGEMKLTQAALARALGAPLLSIQEWEAGKLRPPPMLGFACAALAAGLAPWSISATPIVVEAEASTLPGLVAQIVSLRQSGYEPVGLSLKAALWDDLSRSALGTPFEHLITNAPHQRELAGVAIEIDAGAASPTFSCNRAR